MEPEHVGRCVKRSLQFLLPTGEQRRLLTQQMLLFFGGGGMFWAPGCCQALCLHPGPRRHLLVLPVLTVGLNLTRCEPTVCGSCFCHLNQGSFTNFEDLRRGLVDLGSVIDSAARQHLQEERH